MIGVAIVDARGCGIGGVGIFACVVEYKVVVIANFEHLVTNVYHQRYLFGANLVLVERGEKHGARIVDHLGQLVNASWIVGLGLSAQGADGQKDCDKQGLTDCSLAGLCGEAFGK